MADKDTSLPAEGPNSADAWKTRIQESKDLLQWHRDKFYWRANVERVAGKGGDDPTLPTGAALLPKDYAYSEQKKPLLFYQLPDVVLTPAHPDVKASTAQLFAAVLNEMVGPNDMNALPVVNEVLSDILVAAGVGCAKLGYETFIDPVQKTVEVEVDRQPAPPDPLTGQPAVDPMTGAPMMVPVMEDVPNIISEKYFLSRFSPNDFLFDSAFRGSDWSKCSWLGMRFRLPPHQVTAQFGVPEDDLPRARSTATPTDEQSLAPDRMVQHLKGVECLEIYYRAIDYDPDIGDPDLIRCMIFVEGRDEPVRHENSRTQVVENNRVVGGLRRIPIYPLTLFYVSDMALPPSDCSLSRVLVDEQSKGRTQMWQQRDRNVPLRGVDTTKITRDSLQKILAGTYQEIIQFEGVDNGQSPLFGIPQNAFPQENFNFNNIAERDIQECWGMSGHNLGTQETSGRTATELSLRQQGTETRMATAQARVELWWISIVEGLAALVQQYADLPQYARIVGQQGASEIVEWTKQDIAGEFAFSIRPDSAKRIDQSAERKFRLDAMNLMMNIPGINQGELIKWAAPSLGLNPDTLIMPPQPPPPEPPSISIAIKTESLNPMAPEYANVIALLKTKGIDLAPAPAPQPGQAPPPPGPAGGPVQASGGPPPVNKHIADLSGRLPGGGSATQRPS